jgi:RNA polymerase sigma-70 factor (ECF subfamily)
MERADLDALIELLVTDVRLSMPPAMLEYRGIESAQRLFAAVTFRPRRTYRVVATRANGQPAFGLYLADPHASVYRAYALLFTTAGDHITTITGFTEVPRGFRTVHPLGWKSGKVVFCLDRKRASRPNTRTKP